jgi:hypothetical protein
MNAGNLGTLGVNSGGFLTVSAGGRANIFGTENIESGGQLVNLAGGLIDVKGRGARAIGDDGDVIARSGAIVEMKAGSFLLLDPGATLIRTVPRRARRRYSITLKGALLTMANVDTTYLGRLADLGGHEDGQRRRRRAPGATIGSGDSGYVALAPDRGTSAHTASTRCDAERHRRSSLAQVTGGAGDLTDDRALTVIRAPTDEPGRSLEIIARADDLDSKTHDREERRRWVAVYARRNRACG